MKLPVLLFFWLAIFVLSACKSFEYDGVPKEGRKAQYLQAMEAVRESVTDKGIARDEIFYQFRLDGVKSARFGGGGVRGGCMSVGSEQWDLRGGFRLWANQLEYVGRDFKITRLSSEEMEAALEEMWGRENYKDPGLREYFNVLVLQDSSDRVLSEIRIPLERVGSTGP